MDLRDFAILMVSTQADLSREEAIDHINGLNLQAVGQLYEHASALFFAAFESGVKEVCEGVREFVNELVVLPVSDNTDFSEGAILATNTIKEALTRSLPC